MSDLNSTIAFPLSDRHWVSDLNRDTVVPFNIALPEKVDIVDSTSRSSFGASVAVQYSNNVDSSLHLILRRIAALF